MKPRGSWIFALHISTPISQALVTSQALVFGDLAAELPQPLREGDSVDSVHCHGPGPRSLSSSVAGGRDDMAGLCPSSKEERPQL